MTHLVRLRIDGRPRWATADALTGSGRLLPPSYSLAESLSRLPGELPTGGEEVELATATWLAPVDEQPVWAAGVTFERSRSGRREESADADVYDRVFTADRPELFFKASPDDVRGTGQPVTLRPDSEWDVPEPELAVLAAPDGRVVGYLLGNDMSSRSIEGENPLYLPQAKLWHGSCALGPAIRLAQDDRDEWSSWTISLTITRNDATVYSETVPLSAMRRTPGELLDWLWRGPRFPHGAVLMTGTSIVPTPDVTLLPGDLIDISCPPLGHLVSPVIRLREDLS